MKAFKFLSNTALVFSLALLASCSSNDDLEPASDKVIEFKANLRDVTRATLESNNDVHWDLGDKIYVFGDQYEKAGLFNITPSSIDGATASFTSFERDLPSGFKAKEYYYALYPFGSATFDTKTSMITSVLSAGQTVTEGCTYDKDALVMVACADVLEKVFDFKNVPALIKVNVSNNGAGKVKFIEIVATNEANKLSGNFRASVGYAANDIKFEAISDAYNKNTVKLEIPASDESKDFYIAALPCNINHGFTIKFEDEKGNVVYERVSKSDITLKSSKIYPFGSYDFAALLPEK
jgi:hypothetical protein